MTKPSKAKPKPAATRNDSLAVGKRDEETQSQAVARSLSAPDFRHGQAIHQLLHAQFKDSGFEPGIGDYADAVGVISNKAKDGDLAFASRMLAAQARTLDAIFTEMARRMALNMGEYLGATETYGRIALKAQANSRATLEALAKLHQPREQTVRHVHVNEGGQAVIADQFHQHTGGRENVENADQSLGPANGAAGEGPALLGADPFGSGVPIPSREGQAAMQDARRD